MNQQRSFRTLQHVQAHPDPQLELVEVIVAEVEKKQGSSLLREINNAYPLTTLRHLRRMRSVASDERARLELILCPVEDCRPDGSYPEAIAIVFESFGLSSTRKVMVPLTTPPTIALWVEWSEYWPMPWRAPADRREMLETLHSLRCRAEMHMNAVFNLAEASQVDNASIIVDPRDNTVLAQAIDTSTVKYPLKHAVMVAIESVAQWDLETFPDDNPMSHTTKRPRVQLAQGQTRNRPYLCTGYEIYCLKEPCLMCAMALVHSRVRVVIFNKADPIGGAYTVYTLHGKDELNHRYTVFHLTDDDTDDVQE